MICDLMNYNLSPKESTLKVHWLAFFLSRAFNSSLSLISDKVQVLYKFTCYHMTNIVFLAHINKNLNFQFKVQKKDSIKLWTLS